MAIGHKPEFISVIDSAELSAVTLAGGSTARSSHTLPTTGRVFFPSTGRSQPPGRTERPQAVHADNGSPQPCKKVISPVAEPYQGGQTVARHATARNHITHAACIGSPTGSRGQATPSNPGAHPPSHSSSGTPKSGPSSGAVRPDLPSGQNHQSIVT